MAGNIQGLFPGDLGDLGSATVDREKLEQLKEMLLSENNLEAFSSMAIRRDSTSIQRRPFDRHRIDLKRRKTGAGVVQEQFTPLSRPARKYLELCARVLRCLQRLHVADTEKSSASNLTTYLVEQCINGSSRGLRQCEKWVDEKRCNELPLSPFIEIIAKACFGTIISTEIRESASIEMSASPIEIECERSSQVDSESNLQSEKCDLLLQLPMLMLFRDDNSKDPDDSTLIVYLQLLAAFAEMFPRGDCWASTNACYQTDVSPLDWNGEEYLGGGVSYCNACSTTDMAAIVYSLSLVLARYGGTSGSPCVQMSALICLLKMTDASHISSKYSRKSNDDVDVLSLAWRCVWDRILQSELRYHSSTAQVDSSFIGVGELVIMLLTEIVKGSLTDSICCNGVQAYARIEQDNIWSLPIFSTALDLRSSVPFELASVVINCVGLVEGSAESICTRGIDSTLQTMFKVESEGGRERHFRLAHFCVQFISQAVKNGDQESMRRICPFMSTMFCALLGTECVKLTTYAFKAYRELKFTDVIFDPRHRCLFDTGEIEDVVKLDVLWEDTVYPFQHQYRTEMNQSLWSKLDNRVNINCPYFSLSDRIWLSKNYLGKKRSSTRCNMQTAADLKEYGIKNMLLLLGQSAHDDDSKSILINLPLLSKMNAVKVVLSIAVARSGDDVKKLKNSWNSLEHHIHLIMNDAVQEISKSSRRADLPQLLAEITGIIRLVRSALCINEHLNFVGGLLSIKLSEKLYKSCEKMVQSGKNFSPSGHGSTKPKKARMDQYSSDDNLRTDWRKKIETEAKSISAFSRSSESELDDFDSNDSLPRSKKRKTREKARNISQEHALSNDLQSHASLKSEIDYKNAWMCSFIMILLDPSLASANVIADSLLWPQSSQSKQSFDPNEPHDYLLFIGLVFGFSLNFPVETCNERSDGGRSLLSLVFDVLSNCREVATIASPMHLWGFGTCETLVKTGLSAEADVTNVLSILDPKGSSDLRALKNRPILRYLQARAATKCFVAGSDKFHHYFDDIFAKVFVKKSLRDQNSMVRRAGIQALGAALRLLPTKYHMKIAADALAAFSPKPMLDKDLFSTRQSTDQDDRKSFNEWVDEKVKGADFQDARKASWNESRLAIEADKMRCIGAIGINTRDDVVFQDSICAILVLSGLAKRKFLAFVVLESIAIGRQYEDLETMLREKEIHFIDYWMNMERSLMSLPVALTLPSLVRSMSRLNVHIRIDTFYEDSLLHPAAEEYVYRNASIIVPQIFITHMDLSNDIKEIMVQSNKETFNIPKESSFVWNLVEEIAKLCAKGAVKEMIKSHFHQIYARIVPILIMRIEGIKECDQEVCDHYNDAMNLLESFSIIFKDVQKQVSKRSQLIVMELLNVDIKRNLLPNSITYLDDSLLRSMTYITKVVSDGTDETFKALSTSATECILYARTPLQNNGHPRSLMNAWRTIDVIVGIVQSSKGNGQELEFAICSLLGICSSTENEELCLSVLSRLKMIVNNIGPVIAKDTHDLDVASFLNKTVSCLIQMHEQYQLRLIETIQRSRRGMDRRERSFLPFFTDNNGCALQDGMFNEDGREDWTSCRSTDQDAPGAIVDCITLIYDILADLLNPGASFSEIAHRAVDPFPESEIDSNALKALSGINRKFSLCNMMKEFDDPRNKKDCTNLKQKLKVFLAVASKFRKNISSKRVQEIAENDNNGLPLPHEVRSFLSTLNRLNGDLQTNVQVMDSADSEVIVQLIQTRRELLSLCSKKFHTKVQVAATKCIGECGSLCENLDMLEMESLERTNPFTSDPLPAVYSSALSLLSTMLQSDNIDTAKHAKDTIKSVLATPAGHNCWENYPISAECKRMLTPLSNRLDKLTIELPASFLKTLLSIANKSEEELKVDRSWCWQDAFWTLPDENNSFEDWIKNLVCAIIICCYDTEVGGQTSKSSSPTKGKCLFFPACLSMSASKCMH
eukprot:scaffold2016_cov268-Chaetoceros_neogracile.AAC.5